MSASQLCNAAVKSIVGWRADAMECVDAAIAADDQSALPRLLKAWMLQGSRDECHCEGISILADEIQVRVMSNQSREQILLNALQLARTGQGIQAATQLQTHLHQSPKDLLVHMVAQNEVFWLGRAEWMRELTERAAYAWDESTPGYSAFLAVRSFANEEAGYLEEAERYGLMSLEIDPTDIWAAHSVAHVLHTRAQSQKGIEWLENLSGNWGHSNQLRHHLWWHVCLLLLELGEYDRILDLLTREVRNPESALVRESPAAPIDIQNYASLLIRLELYGVDVFDHWQALSSICANRTQNHSNAFGNIHDMMVLIATDQQLKADELLQSMRERYSSLSGSVALGYLAVGIPACEAVIAHRKRDYGSVLEKLGAIRHDLHLIGASVVQRDVFFHLLVDAAYREGRDDLVSIFLADIERLGLSGVQKRAAYRVHAKRLQV